MRTSSWSGYGCSPEGLTCFAGLAAWNGEESAAALVARADAAFYDAKGADRNALVTAS